MSQQISLSERITKLVKKHGSLRAVANITKVDVGYLSRLRNGDKTNPTKITLRRLGLVRVMSYYFIEPTPQLTPAQMLEAAKAKGIKWTKKWPKVSGWHVCDWARRAQMLRWVDVDKRTISLPASYSTNKLKAAELALSVASVRNSAFSFSKPWWVQS